MPLEKRLSAAEIACVACGSGMLAFTLITLSALPGHHADTTTWMWVYGFALLLTIAAVVMMYKTIAAFQRGIDAAEWSQPSLDKLKDQLNQPAATAGVWLMATVVLVYVVIDLTTHYFRHRGGSIAGLSYFWLSPVVALGSLRRALKPKSPHRQSLWGDDLKPIHSDQWGNRGPETHPQM